MKNPRPALLAAAIPLLLTSLRLTAGELPFNAPTTELAKESAPLLHQTARALNEPPATSTLQLPGGMQISNLWLFPTADTDTVFARYNLTSNQQHAAGAAESATEHLTLLTVSGNRIVQARELTSSPSELASNEPARLHWSAAFGTGYAAHMSPADPNLTSSSDTGTNITSSSHVAPPVPHWTASIGTGAAASTTADARNTKQPPSAGTPPVAATAHWTSRIGTGHPFDSASRVM